MAPDIMAFFDRYVHTLEKFRTDSFFFPNKLTAANSYGSEIVKILVVSEIDDPEENDT
jgi:hypothetical protein